MTTSSVKPYGFFLDTISSYGNAPIGSVIMGETSVKNQAKINKDGYYFGISAAFWSGQLGPDGITRKGTTGDAAKSWSLITAANNNNAIKNLTGQAKALAINEAALVYPVELDPSIRKEDPASWFYAQNFQVKYEAKAAENYALVTTALWAANQLYPNTKIIPVFDSYYVKGLNLTPSIVADVNKLTKPLGIPALSKISAEPPANLGTQWNMISTLFNNGLIDGWIGDIYGYPPNDPTNLSGKLPTPYSPFYSKNPAPYALQSRADYIKTKPTINSDYYDPKGIMPFNASIDFNGDLTVPVGYSPSSQLTPVVWPYPTTVFAPIDSPAPISNPISLLPESILTSDGYTQFTDTDDSLIGQADINHKMMGGNDSVEIIGGNNNFVNGNRGKDNFKVRGGDNSIYLGGADIDTFEIFAGVDNYFNGQKGEDRFVIRDGLVKVLGGDDIDLIEVLGAADGSQVNGNKGEDTIIGSVAGVTYHGGADADLMIVSQGDVYGDKGVDTFRGVSGEGYAVIQDYSIGEDLVEINMEGSWSNVDDGLMFTDKLGDQIMLLVNIDDAQQVTMSGAGLQNLRGSTFLG